MTANDPWALIERNVRDTNNGVTRLPFDMIKLVDLLNTSLSNEQIFATGKSLLSRKHEVEGNHNLKISIEARFTFQSLLIQVVSWLGLLVENVLTRENKHATGFDVMINALTRDRSVTIQTGTSSAQHLPYSVHKNRSYFITKIPGLQF